MNRLLEWFVRPAANILEEIKSRDIDMPSTKDIPTRPALPTNQFRPLTFDQYIGQTRAKKILHSYIEGTHKHRMIFPHTLIIGNAGYGKSTLTRILATKLKVPFVETIAGEITAVEDIQIKLYEANGGIVFIDEIHSLVRGLAESLYPMMQDFQYEGRPIQPFTLIGATTELGEIIKNRKPFVDRFKIHLELENYTAQELALITNQYCSKTFPTYPLTDDIFLMIGKNSRYTPRMAIRLAEACVYLNGNLSEVLDNFRIVQEGYTHKDILLLDYLTKNEKGVGLQGLASYLNTSAENYLHQIEPFLLQNGLILRTARGRKITTEGLSKLNELRQKCLS